MKEDRAGACLIPTEYLRILKGSSRRADCSCGGQRGGLRHGRCVEKRRLKGGSEVAMMEVSNNRDIET